MIPNMCADFDHMNLYFRYQNNSLNPLNVFRSLLLVVPANIKISPNPLKELEIF